MAAPSWAERLYRALLRLFPSEFRGDFGDEMTDDFRQQQADAAAGGRGSVARLWTRTSVDVVRRAPLEHLDVFRRDATYAVRLLTRRPGFAAVVLATLAIGIGLNTAVFSVVRAVLLRPLPIPESRRLVRLFDVSPPPARDLDDVSSANFIDWATQTRTLDGLALVGGRSFTLIGSDDPEQILAMTVSPQFFQLLQTRPALGRLFVPDDYAPFTAAYEKAPRQFGTVYPSVVVLGYDLWQRRFGGRADMIGSTVRLDDREVEVVGVLPRDFAFSDVPNRGHADCWLPNLPDPAEGRRARMYGAIGRLAPGASLSQAQAEFGAIGPQLAARYPEADKGRGIRVMLLLESETTGVATELWLLFGAAACVLLIACANVANLLLAHASGRRLELATRLALGATRGQLIRQTLTESLVISGCGGIAGLLLARWAVPSLVALAPAGIPRLHEVFLDRSMLGFAAIVTLAVGIGCGLAVVFSMDRVNLHAGGLRPAGADARHHGRLFRQGLTIAEIALALMLVVGAGLLIRTMRALGAQDLGFNPKNVLSIGLTPNWQKYPERATFAQLQADLVTRLSSAPGVTAIGLGSRPLGGGATTLFRAADQQENLRMTVDEVSPRYLEALGARLLEGRFVADSDTAAAPRIALVNSTAARLLFGASDALGQTIVMDDARLTVVGVVADVRRGSLELPPGPGVYLSHLQPSNIYVNNLLVRTAGDPREILPQARAVMRQLDPEQALTRIGTLQERIDEILAPRRFMLRLVGLFSALALGLAVLGVYGVVAESVAQRVPEIGIRVALGATPGAIRRLVVGQGVWMLLVGLAAGITGAVLLRQTMASLVFGVRTTDPIVYAVACGALAAAAIAACAIPASRAAALDPVAALRQE